MMGLSVAGWYRVLRPMASSRAGKECQTFTKGAGQIASGLALEASLSQPNRVVVPFGPGSVP